MIRFSPLVTKITDPNHPSRFNKNQSCCWRPCRWVDHPEVNNAKKHHGKNDDLEDSGSSLTKTRGLALVNFRPEAKTQRNDGLHFFFTSINFQVWGLRVSVNIIQCHHLRKQNPPIYILPILYCYFLRNKTTHQPCYGTNGVLKFVTSGKRYLSVFPRKLILPTSSW